METLHSVLFFFLGTCLGESDPREECSTSAGHVLQAVKKHLQSRKEDRLNTTLQIVILNFLVSAWIVCFGLQLHDSIQIIPCWTRFGNLFFGNSVSWVLPHTWQAVVLVSFFLPPSLFNHRKGGSWYYWLAIFPSALLKCSNLYLWMKLVIEMFWGYKLTKT